MKITVIVRFLRKEIDEMIIKKMKTLNKESVVPVLHGAIYNIAWIRIINTTLLTTCLPVPVLHQDVVLLRTRLLVFSSTPK